MIPEQCNHILIKSPLNRAEVNGEETLKEIWDITCKSKNFPKIPKFAGKLCQNFCQFLVKRPIFQNYLLLRYLKYILKNLVMPLPANMNIVCNCILILVIFNEVQSQDEGHQKLHTSIKCVEEIVGETVLFFTISRQSLQEKFSLKVCNLYRPTTLCKITDFQIF